MDKIRLHQARHIQSLLHHPSWCYFERFIADLIVEKISTNAPKEVLVGMKSAIDEAKKLVATYEIQEG